MHQKCSNFALTNLLFGLFRFVWINDSPNPCPNAILELQHGPLPPKCCELENVPQFLLLPLSSSLDLQLSPSKSLGVHHFTSLFIKNVLLKNNPYIDLFFKMGDIQETFVILTHCFMQQPLYLSEPIHGRYH